MAELLVKAIDATHPDPVKDKQGCYKRGDVVVAMPDGHKWGKEERLPKFVIVKIPDLSIASAQKYIQEEVDGKGEPITRRLFQVEIDKTPLELRNELETKGEAMVLWNNIKGFVKDKVTGAPETLS